MISKIYWSKTILYENLNPFVRGEKERPLKLTLHTSELEGLEGNEAFALNLLKGFRFLNEIELITTGDDEIPNIEINKNQDNSASVKIQHNQEIKIVTFIHSLSESRDLALELAELVDSTKTSYETILEDIILTQSHIAVEFDLFVSLSPMLLKNRNHQLLKKANIVNPLEALKIVGIYLRSRENYIWYASKIFRGTVDFTYFYWALYKIKLPNLPFLCSACIHASKIRNDNTDYLGQSVLNRSIRTLQALDLIAIEFYKPQHNGTRDKIMYHFDYIMLLLVGAFDAQARIAHRAYGVTGSEYYASFRNAKFQKSLKKNGALSLYTLATSDYFENVMLILHKLRNTVHSAALNSIGFQSSNKPQESFVEIPKSDEEEIIHAIQTLGGFDEWGIEEWPGILVFEPYTFAANLVKKCFGLINEIAIIIDKSRLLLGQELQVIEQPKNDNLNVEFETQCINFLGSHEDFLSANNS